MVHWSLYVFPREIPELFPKSRFVVVDDKLEHLKGIKEALDTLRIDCHSKVYDVETSNTWEKLPGTRILFMDKTLRPGVTMGGGTQDSFAAIADVIQSLIDPDSGPYGLILWAEQPELEALKNFLYERLAGIDPRLVPVFFAELRKSEYIRTDNGDLIDASKLEADIVSALGQSPQMKALFSWEADVAAAADAVLRSLVDLVPDDKRASDGFASELGKVIFRLSQAGAGVNRAMENPRESVNRVLVPILADRITEHDPEAVPDDVWNDAVVELTGQERIAPVPAQAAVNTAIHLSFARSQNSVAIKPTDLGAVLEFPYEDVDEALQSNFGITRDLIAQDTFFGLGDGDWERCKLKLIQIGAACDHAQPKDGTLVFLLGLEWEYQNADGTKTNSARLYQRKSPKNEQVWSSPTILIGANKRPGKLSAFLNCTMSKSRNAVDGWATSYRLRDELVSKLTQEYARHISRPGIVTLGPDS